MPPGCIILCLPNTTLSCNPGPSFQIFVVARLNRGNYALSRQEDPPEKEMATHSSILAWKIPWTEEPGGLQSMGSKRVNHDWVCACTHMRTHTRKSQGEWWAGFFPCLSCSILYICSPRVTKEFDANLVTKQQTKDGHVLILGTPEYASSCH